jgi:SagB-type dehydrogenase family enzyme
MKTLLCFASCLALAVVLQQSLPTKPGTAGAATAPAARDLPTPTLKGAMSLEEALSQRRSIRQFADRPLDLAQLSQLCWAAQGITEPGRGLRTAPSAGALYPIELYIVTAEGTHHYAPKEHRLDLVLPGDLRPELQKAANNQQHIGQAGAVVVITAVVERTAKKYGPRAERFCYLESGHIAQNILLQATSLHLGCVPMGAFDDDAVAKVLRLPKEQSVMYIVAVGYPR